MKKILKYVAYGFLSFLIILCVYTFVVTDILKKDHVNVFGYTYFVVATGSMSGTIEVNDIIFVKITKDVEKNDIISYKNKSGEIITHRLIDKSKLSIENIYFICNVNNIEKLKPDVEIEMI